MIVLLGQELQHAQRLERLREEQRAVQDKVTQKQQFEHKYEPCVVCGDRASGQFCCLGSRVLIEDPLFRIEDVDRGFPV